MRASRLISAVNELDSTEQMGFDLYSTARPEAIRLLSSLPVYADDDLDKPGAAFVHGVDACWVADNYYRAIPIAVDLSKSPDYLYRWSDGRWGVYNGHDDEWVPFPLYSTEQSALAAIERMKGGAK